MDLLAAILAYLGTVTAIIVTVVMSYDVFIYTPSHSINPQHTVTVAAKPRAAVVALSASAGKIARPKGPDALSSRSAPTAKTDTAAERRAANLRREAARQRHVRRLARQVRGREWAAQQPPGTLGLGYAEAPPAGLYNAFPYR